MPGASSNYPVEKTSSQNSVQGTWLKNEASVSESADLSTAKYVISGGRGLKNGDNFKLLYDFAAALGK
jgi:electron transfer flavoprotein alpha subunit